ncbi:MAG TPA: hypothetical protein GXZ90_05825 [Clostridiales bacterium]|nr:hypothetical protein [Clostridiales bacterium]
MITEKDQDGFTTGNLEINLTYMFFNKNRPNFFADYEFMDGKYSKPDIFK